MKKLIILFTVLFLGLITFVGHQIISASDISDIDCSKYFENNTGYAIFFKDDKYYTYNNEMANIQKSPCSTFKIVLTLAGLKYGALKDENTVIKWDGEKRYFDEWTNRTRCKCNGF